MPTARIILCAAVLLAWSPALAQDQLVLVSPHWEGVRYEFGRGFQARYRQDTGRQIELKWLDVGGASDILKFIRSEFRTKPDGIGVDLFFGGGTDPYAELHSLGLLQTHRPPSAIHDGLAPGIGGVPLRADDDTWYAATMAGFGIIYNKVLLRRLGLPEPRTWEDLASPEAFSWVGSADPRKSGSVHMAYEIILQAYGWERGWQLVTALGANVRSFSGYASQTPKDVAVGEVLYGLSIDSFAWHQVREVGEELIGFIMPADLTVVNGDAIALLKGAPTPAAARRFVDFVLSDEGQRLWMLNPGESGGPEKYELGKFSVRPGLYDEAHGRSSVRVNPFEWQSSFVYDAARGSARWALVNDLIGAFVIEPQRHLARAWRAAAEDGLTQDEAADLARMPLTEEEAMAWVAAGRWQDPEFRNRTLNEWSALARDRYGAHEGGVGRNAPALAALLLFAALFVYVRRSH